MWIACLLAAVLCQSLSEGGEPSRARRLPAPGPTDEASVARQFAEQPTNVLIVIADDMGVDRVAAYGEHPSPPSTPVLDTLAAQGVLFRNAWSQPVCSPSRATLLTGLSPHGHGIGNSVSFGGSSVELDTELPTIADLARRSGRATLALGKWHLGALAQSGHGHPLAMGFDAHVGTGDSFVNQDGPSIYFHWTKVTSDGRGTTEQPVDHYATSETVDDALARIEDFGDQPWLVWLAFHAPHLPLHAPPAALHDQALTGTVLEQPIKHHKAMVTALDTELGRLLSSLRPATLAQTLIVFVGDNGTPGAVSSAPFASTKAKGTVFEGGVNVPLIVAGAGVPAQGQECAALVQFTDLMPTLAELFGQPAPVHEGVSLVPYFSAPGLTSQRRFGFAERFKPNLSWPHVEWSRAVRDGRYKLMRVNSPLVQTENFYDLWVDTFEQDDLLFGPPLNREQAEALQRLSTLLDAQQGLGLGG